MGWAGMRMCERARGRSHSRDGAGRRARATVRVRAVTRGVMYDAHTRHWIVTLGLYADQLHWFEFVWRR